MRRGRYWVFAVVAALVLALTPDLHVKAQDTDRVTYATIDPPDAIYSEATDINSSGEIVGRFYDGSTCDVANTCLLFDGHNHGFLLSHGEFTTIDSPGSIFTAAIGINPRGDIVGRYVTADGKNHGFLLRGGEFTTIDFPDATASFAWGINPRGDIVGQYTAADGKIHGYLLREGEFTTIDFPDSIRTNAVKINPTGDIVGRYLSTDGRSHAFLRRRGEFTSIDFPGAFDTAPFVPTGINASGDIVSHYCEAVPCTVTSNGNIHAFLLNGGEFTSFDFPDSFVTVAFGINARGDIVGAYKDRPTTTCTISPVCSQGHGFLRTMR